MTDSDRIEAAFDADIADKRVLYEKRGWEDVEPAVDRVNRDRQEWRESPEIPAKRMVDRPTPWRIAKYCEGTCEIRDANGDDVVNTEGCDSYWFDYPVAVLIVDAVNAKAKANP